MEAAKLLGLEKVPTIRLESLTPVQVRAYVIADNRLAEDAGWDQEILKIDLQHLIIENEIDISHTGLEVAEIDLILNRTEIEDPDAELPDDLPSQQHSARQIRSVSDQYLALSRSKYALAPRRRR